MPAKNSIKISVVNGFYHLYNRGVDKQDIFKNDQDYHVFLNYLKESLGTPQDQDATKKIEIKIGNSVFLKPKRQPKNFYKDIELVCYSLMPNHFHLTIKQNKEKGMKEFMRSLCTRYSMYFNKAYDRVGPLFQGIYKAIFIENEEYLLHLSRYIHLNPYGLYPNLAQAYSSYANYLGLKKTSWLNPEYVLDFFNNKPNPEFKKFNSYKKFVESSENFIDLGNLTLETDV